MYSVESVDDVTIVISCNSVIFEFSASTYILAVFASSFLFCSVQVRVSLMGMIVACIIVFELFEKLIFFRYQRILSQFGAREENIIILTHSAIAIISGG
ncbi:unnamed protein product [Moneuplotes crassus]|uniref:Uncharacterized protein n=1 Tax=Euplotes crassus TaxID=5936 RepID=A0AAD1XSV3_EUPCR|nr:unnamed protein product [Moneuplotes crassus]